MTGIRTANTSSDRSASTSPWSRHLMLGVLAVDGVLSAIGGALFLPLYLGPTPVPISALLSGLLNAALVWAGVQWTATPRLAALPLWSWLLTFAALTLGGPGGDIVFGGTGFGEYRVLLYLILGAGPPAAVLWRRTRAA